MRFNEISLHLIDGKPVRIKHWQGFWIMQGPEIFAVKDYAIHKIRHCEDLNGLLVTSSSDLWEVATEENCPLYKEFVEFPDDFELEYPGHTKVNVFNIVQELDGTKSTVALDDKIEPQEGEVFEERHYIRLKNGNKQLDRIELYERIIRPQVNYSIDSMNFQYNKINEFKLQFNFYEKER